MKQTERPSLRSFERLVARLALGFERLSYPGSRLLPPCLPDQTGEHLRLQVRFRSIFHGAGVLLGAERWSLDVVPASGAPQTRESRHKGQCPIGQASVPGTGRHVTAELRLLGRNNEGVERLLVLHYYYCCCYCYYFHFTDHRTKSRRGWVT